MERLADLGLVSLVPDGPAMLTAAGRAIGAEIVTEEGIEVVYRADPATADAAEMLTSLLMLDEDAAVADLTAWAAVRPSAADELLAVALSGDPGPGDVLGLLELAGSALGPDAERAARRIATAGTGRS